MTAMAHSAGWSLAASMALALVIARLRGLRRRAAINEALHELRRPLQAIALSPSPPGAPGGATGSMRLVATALERLESAVNGGGGRSSRECLRCESVLRSAVGRWRARVALEGGSLELRWRGGEALLLGDRDALERAIDNLIVNAIEHGGPRIVVEGRRCEGRLRVSVADSGPTTGSGRDTARPLSRDVLAYAGRRGRGRRRGYGLAVVRRVAAEHDGRFVLRHSAGGSLAVLELPLEGGAGPTVDA